MEDRFDHSRERVVHFEGSADGIFGRVGGERGGSGGIIGRVGCLWGVVG